MPDCVLQNHNCDAALQHRPSYNVIMSIPTNEQSDKQVASTGKSATSGRTRARFYRAGLFAAALLGAGMLAAACGGTLSSEGVASLGKTTTTTGPSAAEPKSPANPVNSALAYVSCMRSHGEPDMPDPSFNRHQATLDIPASIDPNSPQYAAANKACKHLLPNNGVPKGNTFTPAEEADYLKGAECMRSHGFPNFPDPTFHDGTVSFYTRSPIDTGSSQYKRALAICERLIPKGLPYSISSGS